MTSVIELVVQHLGQGDADSASRAAEKALRQFPEHAGLIALHGISQFQLGNLDLAEARLREALDCGGPTPVVCYHLGLLAQKNGAVDVAANYYEKVLALDGGHYPALLNLGNCLFQRGSMLEAKECFSKALHMSSDQRIHKNLGVIGIETNELHVAEHHLREALRAVPDWHEAKLNLSFCLLKQQRYDEGWKLYEARLETDSQRKINAPRLPRWDGKSRQKVLIWTEQGVGDAIMFLSLLPEIIERSSCVGVLTDTRLHSLLTRSFGPDLQLFDTKNAAEILKNYDAQASIESCPQFFRFSPDDFLRERRQYIRVDSKLKDKLRAQFESRSADRLKLGVSWRTVNSEIGGRRTIPFEALLKVLPADSCHLINLQYGDIEAELTEASRQRFHMSHPEGVDFIEDLDGFAAALAACDYVVTIDNSTAHFAGAIGVPQTVLLPYICDWRWGVTGQAIWYENCRLARQRERGDWSGPLAQIAGEVRALINGHLPQ